MIAACGAELDGDPAELDSTAAEPGDPAELVDPAELDALVAGAEQAGQLSAVQDAAAPKIDVWFTDLILRLNASGKLEKLDEKKDVYVKLEAKARGVATCTNPGGNEPPGKSPVHIDDVEVSGAKLFPAKKIEGGKLTFSVTTKAPPTRVHGAPDCPNKNWKETIVDLKFKKATLTIQQGNEKPLIVRCTFDKPTEDGPVPKKHVTCTSK